MTEEVFPSRLDVDISDMEATTSPTKSYFWDSSDASMEEDEDATRQEQLVDIDKRSSRKRKSNVLSDTIPVTTDEIASYIQRSIRRKVTSAEPSLYSLLRAWVLQDNPRRIHCKPKRKSLLEYARMAQESQATKLQTNANQPLLWSSIGMDAAPPIDLLAWFELKLFNGWKPYVYSQYTQLRQLKSRNDRSNLQKNQRQEAAKKARETLSRKGVVL